MTFEEAQTISEKMIKRGFDVSPDEVLAFAADESLPPSVIGDEYDDAREAALCDLLDIDITPIDQPRPKTI